MEAYKMEFLRLPYEERLMLFDTELLLYVQAAYEVIEAWRKDFLLVLEEHKNDNVVDFRKAVKKIVPLRTKEQIDPAIEELKKILPKNIVVKIDENTDEKI